MRTFERNFLTTLSGCVVLTAVACFQSPSPSTPSERLVQRELRRELNTRFIDVLELSPDSLLVAIRGGRLISEGRGRQTISAEQRTMIARRALELLAPNPTDRPPGLRWIVVEVADIKRFGPIVAGRGRDRTVHEIATLTRDRPDSLMTGNTLGGSLRPATVGDSVR